MIVKFVEDNYLIIIVTAVSYKLLEIIFRKTFKGLGELLMWMFRPVGKLSQKMSTKLRSVKVLVYLLLIVNIGLIGLIAYIFLIG